MDLEGSCFGAFLGEEEKRRAEKKVQAVCVCRW